MKNSLWHNIGAAALLIPLLLVGCEGPKEEFGLPVNLDVSSSEVRSVLGAPTQAWNTTPSGTVEWYFPHGIVAEFEHDRLSSVTLFKDTIYKDFNPYVGKIVNGVDLADSKTAVLKKMGSPSKVESEDLLSGTDPDKPERWAMDSRYYWRSEKYEVRATFLNQAKIVGEDAVWPKDTLTEITIQTFGHGTTDHSTADHGAHSDHDAHH